MIRPLTLMDSRHFEGSDGGENSTATRLEVSDYLYLVADCLTVLFHESESLGLSGVDLLATANQYLGEARLTLGLELSTSDDLGLPARLNASDEIPAVASAIRVQAQLLDDAEFQDVMN